MVLVQVSWDKRMIKVGTVTNVVNALSEIVAEALSCTEEPLTYFDVVVHVREVEGLDFQRKDLVTFIWAHDYAERRRDLTARRERIVKEAVEAFLPIGTNGAVTVFLAPSSSGEFSGSG